MIFEKYLIESGLVKYFEKNDCNIDICLYHDLGLYGDIAESYIELLCSSYGVDISRFCFDKYFPSEFSGRNFWHSSFLCIFPIFRNKYNARFYFERFTFRTILNAISEKKLE